MLRVFIGWDPSEVVAWHVLAHSITRHATEPLSITALRLEQLPLTRERDPWQSTEFSYSRFLVPYLCGFAGTAIFMDCDMLCRADISELVAAADLSKPVSVVQHDYRTRADLKFLEQTNVDYGRKNWSSLMVFNCSDPSCRRLTPEYVNTARGLDLHQFAWADSIGALPAEWNHLVGEFKPNPLAKLAHFTLGTPCFAKYRDCEYAQEWHAEQTRMLAYDRSGEFSKPEKLTA